MKEEMKKLASDSSFVDALNSVLHQKKKCKQIIDWSCTAQKDHKKEKCIFKAIKPCMKVFMQKLETCLEGKGFSLPPFMRKHNGTVSDLLTTPIPDVSAAKNATAAAKSRRH